MNNKTKIKIIPKEKAKIFCDKYGDEYYCFDYNNHNYLLSGHNHYEILSDVTVNERNEIHSYNDQPAFIYKDQLGINKMWFINGINKRENPERADLITKGSAYYIFDTVFSLGLIRKNLNDHNS
jgi:hypothetical protein